MVKTDRKPDFAKAYSKANEIHVKSSVIKTFPFSAESLIKEQSDIVCCTYSKALKYGLDVRDFGSESAIIVVLGGRFILFYDDSKVKSHIEFSLIHEFGHCILGHKLGGVDKETYARYEVETNFFTAQILMPEQVIRELQKRHIGINNAFLQERFGVSSDAAEKRITTLAKTNVEWRSREEKEFDDIILNKYLPFVEAICPSSSLCDFEEELSTQAERDSWLY